MDRTSSRGAWFGLLLGAVLLLTGCPTIAPERADDVGATTWDVTPDLEVRRLAPGVWMHTSWKWLDGVGRFPSNGLLIRDGDALTLIDTAWGEPLTRALLDWIDATLTLPVTRAVLTHFHDDRMGGAATLAARGIPSVGHPLTTSLLREHGHALPPPQAVPDLEPGRPRRIGAVEVLDPGPGHTRDNLVVWVPHARVLFGGCAVKSARSRGLGNVADADLAAWPDAVRRMLATYPAAQIVVPGHGEPGDATLLTHTLELLEAARAAR